VRSLQEGQPVTRQDVASVPKGMQLKVITTSAKGVTLAAVRPASRVDLLITQTENGQKASKTVAQDVLILGSEAKEGRDKPGPITLVVAVTAEQAAKLTDAEETGEWSAVVRKPSEK
jgi:Flp pilus assembly protein CpaB